MKTTILMYHAVHSSGYGPVTWDPHYAVSDASFRAQMTSIRKLGFRLSSVLNAAKSQVKQPTVCITFDDGGATDVDVAAPILYDLEATADFFVSADHIGKKGFASWTALRSLAHAGMSIQSHGRTHRLLDDLSYKEIRYELETSKGIIEDKLGQPVTLFAPPGGRLPAAAKTIAQEVGYSQICSSRPGRWRKTKLEFIAPRFPVLATTPQTEIVNWAQGAPVSVARSIARHAFGWTIKQALGNRRYNALRETILQLINASRH